jgi:AraC family transcriptional regulator, regulatory protein of adaptative response / methylated-DNA-[protein]-cysteine methyltransferase
MNTHQPSTASIPVVGVRTTRIYCRPDCRPGRDPLPENCIPFLDAPAARAAGFRACKKCRPDEVRAPRIRVGYATGTSPIGEVFVAATKRGLCALYVLTDDDLAPALDRLRDEWPDGDLIEDSEVGATYLPRVLTHLVEGAPCDDVPLDLRGTPFQLRVWEALRAIPHGTTTTYGALAETLGLSASAARAVGTACGANPVSLLVPCHRVVRAGGGLGGYEWGLDRKQTLLDIESGAALVPS